MNKAWNNSNEDKKNKQSAYIFYFLIKQNEAMSQPNVGKPSRYNPKNHYSGELLYLSIIPVLLTHFVKT